MILMLVYKHKVTGNFIGYLERKIGGMNHEKKCHGEDAFVNAGDSINDDNDIGMSVWICQ